MESASYCMYALVVVFVSEIERVRVLIRALFLYLSVNVFSTKVLIGDTIITSPNGDGTAILRSHPSHAKVSPLAVQRK